MEEGAVAVDDEEDTDEKEAAAADLPTLLFLGLCFNASFTAWGRFMMQMLLHISQANYSLCCPSGKKSAYRMLPAHGGNFCSPE